MLKGNSQSTSNSIFIIVHCGMTLVVLLRSYSLQESLDRLSQHMDNQQKLMRCLARFAENTRGSLPERRTLFPSN